MEFIKKQSLYRRKIDNKELIIHVDMVPIGEFKTKWFITIRSNYMKDDIPLYSLSNDKIKTY